MNVLEGLDALLITDPINIRYLTGFIGLAPDEREGYLLLTQRKNYLFVNALYVEQAKNVANNPIIQYANNPINKIEVIQTSREEPFSIKLKQIFDAQLTGPGLQTAGSPQADRGPVTKLGFEETNVTVAEYLNLRTTLTGVQLLSTRYRVEMLRMIKRPDEIANIRQAATLTDECLTYILDKLTPGVTEIEIASEIEFFFKKRGAGIAFPPIVAFGANSSQPHYASGNTALGYSSSEARSHDDSSRQNASNNNTLILLDFGCKINGYCSDMTRMACLGKPTSEQQKAYDALLAAQLAALHYLEEAATTTFARGGLANGATTTQNVSGAKADQIARDVLASYGFPVYPHTLGHSLGLSIHEPPRLSVKQDAVLQPNMVVTVEPGIYKEGSYGIRIEDLVVLTDTGVEILSKSDKKLIHI